MCRRLVVLVVTLAAVCCAQISPHQLRIIPTSGGSPVVGESRYVTVDNVHYVGFKAPATIASNVIWSLPNADATGCLQSNGSGVLSISACGGTYTAGTGVTIASSVISIGQAVGTSDSPTFYVPHVQKIGIKDFSVGGAPEWAVTASINVGTGVNRFFIQETSGATALTLDSVFQMLTVNYSLAGTHLQNIGTSDSVTFSGIAMNGSFSGTHAQNVGAGDTVTFSTVTSGDAIITGAAGTNRIVDFVSGSTLRWQLRTNNATESGSNVGSNFELRRYNDAGTVIDIPISIARSTGVVTIPNLAGSNAPLVLSGSTGALNTSGSLYLSAGSVLISPFVQTQGVTVTTSGVDVTGASTFHTGIAVAAGSIVQSGAGGIYSGTSGFIYNGSFAGVTSTTCSQFRGGICTAP